MLQVRPLIATFLSECISLWNYVEPADKKPPVNDNVDTLLHEYDSMSQAASETTVEATNLSLLVLDTSWSHSQNECDNNGIHS